MLDNDKAGIAAKETCIIYIIFERRLFETEKLITSALKKWLAYKPVSDIEKQLDALSENPLKHQLIKELCLKLWIVEMKFKKNPEPKFTR